MSVAADDGRRTDRTDRTDRRWFAPWWVYLVAVLAVGAVRRVVVGRSGLTDAQDVGVAVVLALVTVGVVTVVHRLLRR